jgi:hypothetical protein
LYTGSNHAHTTIAFSAGTTSIFAISSYIIE